MLIKKFVADHGSYRKASAALAAKGFSLQHSRLYRISAGEEQPTARNAVQIEITSRGKYKAQDIMQETLRYWRKELRK